MNNTYSREDMVSCIQEWFAQEYTLKGVVTLYYDLRTEIETQLEFMLGEVTRTNAEPVVYCIDSIPDEIAQKIIEKAKSLKLRHCNKLGWAFCCGNCDECRTTITTTSEVENNG